MAREAKRIRDATKNHELSLLIPLSPMAPPRFGDLVQNEHPDKVVTVISIASSLYIPQCYHPIGLGSTGQDADVFSAAGSFLIHGSLRKDPCLAMLALT